MVTMSVTIARVYVLSLLYNCLQIFEIIDFYDRYILLHFFQYTMNNNNNSY